MSDLQLLFTGREHWSVTNEQKTLMMVHEGSDQHTGKAESELMEFVIIDNFVTLKNLYVFLVKKDWIVKL